MLDSPAASLTERHSDLYSCVIESHLAEEFDLQGRVGDQDPTAQSGNPLHRTQIKDMMKRYHKQAAGLA